MASRPTARRRAVSEQTRAKLVEATRALLTERGTLDVSIAEITSRAEVNVALVSYHFAGREGLLVEVAREDAQYALAGMKWLLEQDFNAAELLRRHIVGVVRVYFERPYLNRLLQALLREGSAEAAEAVTEFFVMPLAEARRQILHKGIASGQFEAIDVDIIGMSIDGACEHIFSSRQSRKAVLGDGSMTKALSMRYAESMANLYLRGVLAEAARSDVAV